MKLDDRIAFYSTILNDPRLDYYYKLIRNLHKK